MPRKSFFVFMLILLLGLAGCGTPLSAVIDQPDLDQAEVAGQTAAAQSNQPDTGGDLSGFLSEDRLINLYEQLNDSVVNIRTSGGTARVIQLPEEEEQTPAPDSEEFPEIPGFPELPDFDQDEPFQPFPQSGEGSGFVYDKEGHIITNNHVVASAERIVVTFADGREADATLVGADPGSDLAVIQVDVEPERLKPVTLGDSDSLRVGQFVVAIGNPFGLNGSMSVGIVSGLNRSLPAEARTPSGRGFTIPGIIQTDTAINPGNSGGPLLNLDGEVIGVNTAIESPIRGFAGVGYAVPASIVGRVIPDILDDGTVETPWLGISGRELDGDLAAAMGLDSDQRGVLIIEVLEDGPSAGSGLQGSEEETTINGFPALIGGDIVVAIDDQPVNDFDDLLTYIVGQTSVGQTVTLTVLRDDGEQRIEVTLGARPSAEE